MEKLFNIASSVSTPLALAGFFAAVIFFLFKRIIARNTTVLARTHNFKIVKTIIDKLFVLALVAMALGFVAYCLERFYESSKRSGAATRDEALSQLVWQAAQVQNDYAHFEKGIAGHGAKIRERAPLLADQIEAIEEDQLSAGAAIRRQLYLSILEAIGASVEPDLPQKRKCAAQAESGARRTRKMIDHVRGKLELQDVFAWTVEQQVSQLAGYTEALALAVQGTAGDAGKFAEARAVYLALPASYRDIWPAESNPDLRRAFVNTQTAEAAK